MTKPPKLPSAAKPLSRPLASPDETNEFPTMLVLGIGTLVLVLLLMLIWFFILRESGGSSTAGSQSASNSAGDSVATGNESPSESQAAPEPATENKATDNSDDNPAAETADSTEEDTPHSEQKDTDDKQLNPDSRPEEQAGDTAEVATSNDGEASQPADKPSPSTIAIGNISGTVEFLGVESSNGPVSFVIDYSSSMDGQKFQTARSHLVKSILGIDSGQEFSVFLFNSGVAPFKSGKIQTPSKANKKAFASWILTFSPSSGTLPVPAIEAATSTGVSCIFLLSDGEFQVGDTDRIVELCKSRKVIVNTFSLAVESATLRQIAEQTGGIYTFIQ